MSRFVWFALLLAACNPVSFDPEGSTLPDALGPDAAEEPDAMAPAPGPDAMPEPITARVLMNGAPASGVPVIFHDGQGAVVHSATSDLDGRASFLLPEGGMVTVLGGNRSAHTIAGARPGETLTFSNVGYLRGGGYAQATVTFPQSSPVNTYARVLLGGCSAIALYSGTSYTTTVGPECGISQSGSFALMMMAVDNTGMGLGFTELAERPFAAGAVSVPAFTLWYQPAQNGLYGVTGLPAGMGEARTTQEILAADHRLYFPEVLTDISQSSQFTSRTYAFASVGNAAVERVRVDKLRDPVTSTPRVWLIRRGNMPLSGSLDWATVGLPFLGQPTVDSAEGARPRIAFSAPAGLDDTDGGGVAITWLASQNQEQAHWTLSFPPGTTEVRFPALPDDQASYRPNTNIDRIYLDRVFLADIGEGGPAVFRALPGPWDPQTVLPPGNGFWRVTESF